MSLRLKFAIALVTPLDEALDHVHAALDAAGVRAMDRGGGFSGVQRPDGVTEVLFDVIAEDPDATTSAVIGAIEARGIEVRAHEVDVALLQAQVIHIPGLSYDMATGTLTVDAVKLAEEDPLVDEEGDVWDFKGRRLEDVTIALVPGEDRIGALSSGGTWHSYREDAVRGLQRIIVRRSLPRPDGGTAVDDGAHS